MHLIKKVRTSFGKHYWVTKKNTPGQDRVKNKKLGKKLQLKKNPGQNI
jgi:hypothetical protein